jgi:hypothetical protein
MEISPDNLAVKVDEIVGDCLFTETELAQPDAHKRAVLAQGIVRNFGFHPERLEENRTRVAKALNLLPDAFFSKGGGGMSFLNACETRDGTLWGEHRSMEALFVLGIALNLASYSAPREIWSILPGRMPYITIDSDKVAEVLELQS